MYSGITIFVVIVLLLLRLARVFQLMDYMSGGRSGNVVVSRPSAKAEAEAPLKVRICRQGGISLMLLCAVIFIFALVKLLTNRDALMVRETVAASSSEAREVALTELEKNLTCPGPRVLVRKSLRLYPRAVCLFADDSAGLRSDDDRSARVYYPIVSKSHPYAQEVLDLRARYDTLDRIPPEKLPAGGDFRIYVRSESLNRPKEIPGSVLYTQNLQGVVHLPHRHPAQIARELRLLFPDHDSGEFLIIEEQTAPPPETKAQTRLSPVGLVCILTMVLAGVGTGGGAALTWLLPSFLAREQTPQQRLQERRQTKSDASGESSEQG